MKSKNMIHVAFAVALKDMKSWFRDPIYLVASILVPLVLLAVFSLVGFSSASIPIALAPDGNSNSEIVTNAIRDLRAPAAKYFEITYDTAISMEQWNNGKVLGLLEYPGNDETQPIFKLSFFNINADYTKNYSLRFSKLCKDLSVALASPDKPIAVTAENSSLPTDIPIWNYIAVGLVVFSVTFTGLVNSSISVAREWKERTIEELILSPANKFVMFSGKILAGLVSASVNAVLMFIAIYIFYGIVPVGNWAHVITILFFTATLSIGVGIILGVSIKRIDTTAPIAMMLTTLLYLLCGGLGPRGQLPDALWNFSKYLPFTYGYEPFHMVMETSTTTGLLKNTLILGITALISIIGSVLILNRSTSR